MNRVTPQLRSAAPEDAVTLAALAIHVFVDTYATEGVRPDLALEALTEYSAELFARRLREPGRRVYVAQQSSGLIGFAEIEVSPRSAPAGAVVGAELVRLYVQSGFQRHGVGRRLLQMAEQAAVAAAVGSVWLTAWEANHRARGFYAAQGYCDVGTTRYSFQGNSYCNRVLVKRFSSGSGVV